MYLPIEQHGLIGNMKTAALVAQDGAINWLCLPYFDSPSVFGAILDNEKGGVFRIAPAQNSVAQKQVYWPETNVLVTRFLSERGVLQVTDYMPVGLEEQERSPCLIRLVEVVRGEMDVRLTCKPAFDYAREEHGTELVENGAIFSTPGLRLGLSTTTDLRQREGSVRAAFTLKAGECACFGLFMLEEGEELPRFDGKSESRLLRATVDYWHGWLSHCTYTGRWREHVYRSALALKLMTFAPTGAIVAAPTCSLPETPGGERNWDYRFTWLRDAAFTLYALLRIGFTDEARHFMEWLEARCHEREKDGSLLPVYRLDGSHDLREEILDHLEGYGGARPVRIGNGAVHQFQLDIYGELMDAVYIYNKYAEQISYDFWVELSELVDWVCDHWQLPDDGIWEARTEPRHYVYSKLMCWVAVDRGLRLAEKRSFPAPREKWLATRDAIYLDVFEKGWSEERQAFVQHYDCDALDAANLIMPLVFFMSPNDPRMIATLEAIRKLPSQDGLTSDSLVDRYHVSVTPDGLSGEEGAFNMCSFWLVEALTRAGRTDPEKLSEARLMFEKMLSYANPLGLYAEETGLRGEALGNFPQAFTHIALISAAYNLDRTLG